MPVTAIISTKNEELAIAACIQGLNRFDEVLVVDSASDDRTKKLAESLGATVHNFEWNGRYPKKKQWILDNVPRRHDWVLWVDADERPEAKLVDSIAALVREPRGVVAADLRLEYWFAGRKLRFGHVVTKRALMDARYVHFPEVDDLTAPGMGELEGHYQPVAAGEVTSLPGLLVHQDPDPVSSWIDRHNKYSDWEAYLRVTGTDSAVRRHRSRGGRLFNALPFQPLLFFVWCYLVRQGFRDGRAGLDYALGLAFYYWQIDLKAREMRSWRVNG